MPEREREGERECKRLICKRPGGTNEERNSRNILFIVAKGIKYNNASIMA